MGAHLVTCHCFDFEGFQILNKISHGNKQKHQQKVKWSTDPLFAKMQEHRGKLGDEEVSNPIRPYLHRCCLGWLNKTSTCLEVSRYTLRKTNIDLDTPNDGLEKVASLTYGHFWYMFGFWNVNFGEEKLYFLHVFHRFGCQSYMSDCIMTAYEPSSEENTHQKSWLLAINSNNFRNHRSLKLVEVLM